jgi:predicted deacetylase
MEITPLPDDQYLVRFDDICPTMDWAAWEGVERHLHSHSIRPILAVVPDNRDPKLMLEPACDDFWSRVRGWQRRGYAIALHGYQHLYVNKNPGLMRLTRQSEFAGLPRQEQEAKLRRGLEIFAKNGVRADAWVAPSHSFDHTTLRLLADLGIFTVSDGLSSWPFTDPRGVTWVPQQLWRFQARPAGVWTVCCHHNGWSPRQVEDFGRALDAYACRVTDMATVLGTFSGRRRTLVDRLTAFWDWALNHYSAPARARLRQILGSARGGRHDNR